MSSSAFGSKNVARRLCHADDRVDCVVEGAEDLAAHAAARWDSYLFDDANRDASHRSSHCSVVDALANARVQDVGANAAQILT